jgi:hypothetical protein
MKKFSECHINENLGGDKDIIVNVDDIRCRIRVSSYESSIDIIFYPTFEGWDKNSYDGNPNYRSDFTQEEHDKVFSKLESKGFRPEYGNRNHNGSRGSISVSYQTNGSGEDKLSKIFAFYFDVMLGDLNI